MAQLLIKVTVTKRIGLDLLVSLPSVWFRTVERKTLLGLHEHVAYVM